jgi:tRNA threonylcarbamoyladenosine biosynthesis protein TsaE
MLVREWIFDERSPGDVPARILAACASAGVIAFHGPMGAGKTTLIRHLCLALGVRDRVTSPTFALVNEYLARDGSSVLHIDLYRLSGEEEAVQAGIGEVLEKGRLSLVEWPERAPGILPPGTLHLNIGVMPDGRRRVCLTEAGDNRYLV